MLEGGRTLTPPMPPTSPPPPATDAPAAAEATALPASPLDSGPHGSPSPTWAAVRAAGPVARLRAPSGAELHVATGYDDVEFVHRALSRRAAIEAGAEFVVGDNFNAGTSLTTMDPPEHTRLRGV